MQLMQEAEAKLEPILKAYMEEKDIDLILHAQTAVIAKPVADITMDITEALKQSQIEESAS